VDNKAHILSTATLPQPLIDKMKAAGIAVEVLPFIKTTWVNDEKKRKQVAGITDKTIVFSSKNAVEAVAEMTKNMLHGNIYCVGKQTAELAHKYFGDQIQAVANDATGLAEIMLQEKNIKSVTFFCGDIRRDELPELLKKHKIALTEIVVYTTIVTPHKAEREYDAILFFSPSAVESFFLVNKVNSTTILFAIGNTTANAISNKTDNTIMVCEQPGKELLIDDMIRYYSTINKTIS